MRDYLTVADVLAIHADQIERFGGSAGVRDYGLLESALYRPRSGHYKTILEEAAALWESLSQNPPFVDGNKRVAFAATFTFLRANGNLIIADPEETYAFLSSLYEAKGFEFKVLLQWLMKYSKSVRAKE